MRWVFITLLLILSPASALPTDAVCEAVAIAKESRGESLRGSRAVLTVIRNRARILGKSSCQVITAPKQFSWYLSNMKWKVTEKNWTRYLKVSTMPRLLSKDVYYFHSGSRKVKLGKFCCKIGNHTFYYLIRKNK